MTVSAAFARFALPVAGLVVGAAAVAALLVAAERLALNNDGTAARALLARVAALDHAELSPGSALACLDAGAGEAVEDACEKAVFRSAQSAAAAVAYVSARLKLLREAAHLAKDGDGSVMAALVATRRAVALDRYGIAAHVLAEQDGCTARKCAAFALVEDASVLKANLRAQVYDQYVSRYTDAWNGAPANLPPVAQAPAPIAPSVSPVASLAGGQTGRLPPVKPGEKWDFPSASDIPPVSIMNKEPPPPKGAEASAQAPPARASAAPAAKPHEAAVKARKKPPLPPKPPLQVAPSGH